MQPRIIIHAGLIRIESPDLGSTTASDWEAALSMITTAYPYGTAVGIEQAGQRTVLAVAPGAEPQPTEAPPAVFATEQPWTVTVPEFGGEPVNASDQDEAFGLAVEALGALPDRPHEVTGVIVGAEDSAADVVVAPDGVRPGMPSADFLTEEFPTIPDDDPDRFFPAVAADPLPPVKKVQRAPEPGAAPAPVFDEPDEDDVEMIRARAEKMRASHNGRIFALISGAVALVLVLIAGVALAHPNSVPTPAATEAFAGSPISPWSKSVTWSHQVADGSRASATPNGKYTGIVGTDDKLKVVKSADGSDAGSVQLDDTPTIGPRGTTVAGKQALVARTDKTLAVWIEGSKPLTVDLGDLDVETSLTFNGAEPLLTATDNERTWRITPTGLKPWTRVPDNQRAYAMNADGTEIIGAAGPARTVVLDKSGKAKSTAKLTAPKGFGTAARWVLVASDITAILWKGEDGDNGMLAVYKAGSGAIASQAAVSDRSDIEGSSATTATRSPYAAVPGFVIDRTHPTTAPVAMGGLTPSSVLDTRVFGQDDSGARTLADAKTGKTTALKADDLVPWTVLAGGDGLFIVGGVAYAVSQQKSTASACPSASPAAPAPSPLATTPAKAAAPKKVSGGAEKSKLDKKKSGKAKPKSKKKH